MGFGSKLPKQANSAFEKPSRQLLPPHGERPGSLALRHQGTEATEGRARFGFGGAVNIDMGRSRDVVAE